MCVKRQEGSVESSNKDAEVMHLSPHVYYFVNYATLQSFAPQTLQLNNSTIIMKRSSEDEREALLPRDIIVEGSDRRGRLSSDTGGLRTLYGSGKGGGAAGGINDGDEGSEDSGDVDTKALDDGGVPSAVQRMSLASVMFIMCGFIVVTVVNNIYRKKVWCGLGGHLRGTR